MRLILTLSFMAFDMVSGITKAYKQQLEADKTEAKEVIFKSSIMRQGLFNKAGFILVILLGYIMNYAQKYFEMGTNIDVALFLQGFIILIETKSIYENLCAISPALKNSSISDLFNKN